ncbi:unnamed protein product [Amoebophrya sp. A120]|nr:unnamed protein product [Amoebophrya sp. A120]|eukprot:GSA120T00011788001.1
MISAGGKIKFVTSTSEHQTLEPTATVASSSTSTLAPAAAGGTTAVASTSSASNGLLRILLVGSVRGRVRQLHGMLQKFKDPFDVCFCVGEFSSEDMDIEGDLEFDRTPVYFIDCGPACQALIDEGDEEILPGLYFLGHSGVTEIEVKKQKLKIAFLSGRSMIREGLLKHQAAAEAAAVADGAAGHNSSSSSSATSAVVGPPLTGTNSSSSSTVTGLDQVAAYFTSEDLFIDGCYSQLCVERLQEELELETRPPTVMTGGRQEVKLPGSLSDSAGRGLDFFLCAEGCFGRTLLDKNRPFIDLFLPKRVSGVAAPLPGAAQSRTPLGEYEARTTSILPGANAKKVGPAGPSRPLVIRSIEDVKTRLADIREFDLVGNLVQQAEPRYFVCSKHVAAMSAAAEDQDAVEDDADDDADKSDDSDDQFAALPTLPEDDEQVENDDGPGNAKIEPAVAEKKAAPQPALGSSTSATGSATSKPSPGAQLQHANPDAYKYRPPWQAAQRAIEVNTAQLDDPSLVKLLTELADTQKNTVRVGFTTKLFALDDVKFAGGDEGADVGAADHEAAGTTNAAASKKAAVPTKILNPSFSIHGLSFTGTAHLDLEKFAREFFHNATPNAFTGHEVPFSEVEKARRRLERDKREREQKSLAEFRAAQYAAGGFVAPEGQLDKEEMYRWKKKFGITSDDLAAGHEFIDAKRRKLEEPKEKKEYRKSLYHNQRPVDKKKEHMKREKQNARKERFK